MSCAARRAGGQGTAPQRPHSLGEMEKPIRHHCNASMSLVTPRRGGIEGDGEDGDAFKDTRVPMLALLGRQESPS
jgi:hypothetical protein